MLPVSTQAEVKKTACIGGDSLRLAPLVQTPRIDMGRAKGGRPKS